MKGFGGEILYIDLGSEKVQKKKTDRKMVTDYLGGNGFGVTLLRGLVKKNTDPLGPKNPLILAAGTFSGSMIPESSQVGIFARSPLTGFLGETYIRGHLAPEMKFAGYDAFVIRNKSKKPVYLYITEDTVEFRDAKDLWGKDTWETEHTLKERLGPRIQMVSIGQGGENLVRFASLTHDFGRNGGRCGLGTVFGSKKLKAIVVQGSKKIEAAETGKLVNECKELYKQSMTTETVKYREYGTPGGLMGLNRQGALPTRNWQQSQFEGAEKISGEEMKHYWKYQVGCFSCPIACGKLTSFKKSKEEGPEYETIFALGSNCGVDDLAYITKANELCDKYGIDTITTGNIIALAFELGERGIIKDPQLKFGNKEYMPELIRKIAFREGLGKDMADGIVPFAKKYKALEYAVQVKNLEPGGFHASGLPAYALSIAVDVRGADHQRAGAYAIDLWLEGEKRFEPNNKAAEVIMRETTYTIFDSVGLCKHVRKIYPVEKMAELFTYLTGIKMTKDKLCEAGERIYNVEKLINIDLGWTIKDDVLPPRFLKDPLPDGPAKGQRIDQKIFEEMRRQYYLLRGWDEKGIPKATTRKRLGI